MTVLKFMSFIFLLGTASGCVYAMAKVNPGLVSQGVLVLHAVKVSASTSQLHVELLLKCKVTS